MRALILAASVAAFLTATNAQAAGFALELRGGYADLTGIGSTADALFESHGGAVFGGALRVDLDTRWFVRAGAEHLSKSGERVFVADANGPVFSLGHPLDFKLTPAYADVGFRFKSGGDFRAYVGAGAGMAWASEKSEIAGEIEETSTSKFAARGLLGASYGRGHFQIGAELAYSMIPDAAGVLDVSKVYDETDLGGFSAVAVLTFRP